MAEPLRCAECGVPAIVLIVHPDLYHMLVPACGRHGELDPAADLDIVAVDSTEAEEMLKTHTLLRSVIVPRR